MKYQVLDIDYHFDKVKCRKITADLSFWPELEAALFQFITQHQEFQFKDAILSNMNTYLEGKDSRRKFTDSIAEDIKEHDGDLNECNDVFL